jgi:hypothetical protein
MLTSPEVWAPGQQQQRANRSSTDHCRTETSRTSLMPADNTDLCRIRIGVPPPYQHRGRIAAAFDAHS